MTIEEKEEALIFMHKIVDSATMNYDPFNNEQDILRDMSRMEEDIIELKGYIDNKKEQLAERRERKLMSERAKQILKDISNG